jgi:hypothetical protein
MALAHDGILPIKQTNHNHQPKKIQKFDDDQRTPFLGSFKLLQ